MLKYNIRTRSLADQGAIEDVLTVENDVVLCDQADVLEQGCVNAYLCWNRTLVPLLSEAHGE